MEDIFEINTTQTDPRPLDQKVLEASFMVVIMFLAISGNILVLIAIKTHRSLHTNASVFIVNLAIADCLVGSIAMPFILGSNINYAWIGDYIYCNINGLTNSLFCLTSMLTLSAIALDRYCAIIHPLRYLDVMTPRKIAGLIIWVWTQPLLLCLIPIFTKFSRYKYFYNEYLCTVDWGYNYGYSLTIFGLCFMIPFISMVFCYYHILKIARFHSRRIQDSETSGEGKRRAKQLQRDAKAATMLLVVIGTFLCCWLPHFTGILCLTFTLNHCYWPDSFFTITTWLAMLNSACNPVIYGILDKRLRIAMMDVLCCFQKQKRRVDIWSSQGMSDLPM
ncbi:5-hydroxytryptamine receptor 4-like [Amphiura filiformis]|uniref:5-hydroxytryptamine receptor 4-like n=1 Tax=Amphiura filiformis TaxID=82378 RepID=UPI003B228E83